MKLVENQAMYWPWSYPQSLNTVPKRAIKLTPFYAREEEVQSSFNSKPN